MKLVIFIVVPILVIGAVLGLGFAGIVNIPGVTPAKKKAVAAQQDAKPKAPPKIASKKPDPPPAKPKVVLPKPDTAKGEEKLASVWSNMPTPELLKLIATFKDSEVAPILKRMDDEQVGGLLAAMDPKRAATLSRFLQKAASAPPPESSGS